MIAAKVPGLRQLGRAWSSGVPSRNALPALSHALAADGLRYQGRLSYASGVGRRLFGRPALEQLWILFVNLDELDEAFNAEVGERLDTIFANAKDPYGSVLDLHFIGDVS